MVDFDALDPTQQGPKKKKPGSGIDFDALAGGAATATEEPTTPPTGGVDFDALKPLTATPVPGPTTYTYHRPDAPTAATPAPRRGIGDWLTDVVDRGATAIGKVGQVSAAAAQGQQPTAAIPRETRTLARTGDRRTAAQKLESTRAGLDAQIDQRPDATMVAPGGSVQGDAAASATSANVSEQERIQRNFTPASLRDLAKRGMQKAGELNAQAVALRATDPAAAEEMHQHAEEFNRKAYNAQLVADGAENADTFDAVLLSNLLGPISDPYAGSRTNLLHAEEAGMFTPAEQKRDLGKNLAVPGHREFSLSDPRDTVAPLLGAAPAFVAGDAAIAGGSRMLAETFGAKLPVATRIADAIEGLYGERAAVQGPRQAGLGGLKESALKVVTDAPHNVARGMTMGQVPGAILAAREAQQTGDNPVQASIGSVLGNVLIGPFAELGFHAAGEFGRLASRTDLNVGRKFYDQYGMTRPVAAEAPTIARAVEGGRDVQGQTALADKTVDGQHIAIVKLLDAVLGEKGSEEGIANAVLAREATRPLVEPAEGVLRPRTDPNDVPLRSASDVAMERAGPADEANAVVQMERAKRDAAAMQEQVARETEQARIEQAAQQRASEQHGPKTLRETLEQTTTDAQAGEPLAAAYHDAINKFSDAAAAMKDAGETPSERTRLTYARARNALNDARKQYGVQTGAAAIAALAQADDDLTPEEKQAVGLGGLAVGSTAVIRHMPEGLARRAIRTIEEAPEHATRDRNGWLYTLEANGIQLGEHFTDVNRELHEAALRHGGPGADIPAAEARAIFEPDTPTSAALGRDADAEVTSRAMVALDKVRPDVFGGRSATPASWTAKLESAGLPVHEAQGVFDALVAEHGSDTSFLTHEEVQFVIQQGVSASEVAPRSGRFYSRLAKAVEELPGKKWDEPRPAADWIGKLKGNGAFSKTEFEMIESELKAAAQDKRKLSRADVLQLAHENVPAIERHTLAYDAAPHGSAEEGNSNDIVDISDLSPEMGHRELQHQIDHREAAIAEIESAIEDRTNEAESDMNDASGEADDAYARAKREARKAFPDADTDEAVEAALDYIREHVESEYVPRGVVEKAFQTMLESGEFHTLDEPRDPSEFNLNIEEGEKDGAPWWTVTSDDSGNVYEGASKWEALHQAELAGDYDNGSPEYTLPKGHTIGLVTDRKPVTKWKIISADGTSREGTLPKGMTPEQARREVAERYGANAEIRDITPRENQPDQWVMKNHEGRVLQTSDISRDDLTESYARDHFNPPNTDSALQEIRDHLSSYADAQAEFQAKESAHYWMSEGEAFEEEHTKIEEHRDEIRQIESMQEDAPAEGQATLRVGRDDRPQDPYLAPVKPKITGKPQYESYQRIGGGTEYNEYLNVWENNPGKKFTKGHWSKTPDTVSHVRAETHTVESIPGLTGERVEHLPGEGGNVKLIRDQMIEGRHKRAKIEEEQAGIMRQYQALPAATRDEGGGPGYDLAQKYQQLTNDAKNVVEREETLVDRLKGYGVTPEGIKKIRVMVESQADLAQRATEYGINRPPTAEEHAKFEQESAPLQEKSNALRDRVQAMDEQLGTIEEQWRELSREKREAVAVTDYQQRQDLSDLIGDVQDFVPDRYNYTSRDIANVRELDPRFGELAEQWKTTFAERKTLNNDRVQIDEDRQALEARYHVTHDSNAVPPGPFTETRTAQALNVARFLLESANRGDETLAWSDASNRVRNAHLPMPAAELTYNQLIPSTISGLLEALGFPKHMTPEQIAYEHTRVAKARANGKTVPDFDESKVVRFEHTYIKGYGHWSFTFTPEMRAAIRKYGVPVMGVLAAATAPQDAEAQSGEGGGAKALYGTTLGGIAAGVLIAELSRNKRLRALVKENRDLNRLVMLDDLSGLANKKAHALAIESVDRDPKTAWVAFDGDRFKQMNDVYGHTTGDKAIQHFGETMRKEAEKLGIPMRGFRPGGDEFAMAVPKEKAAELLRAVEDASPFAMSHDDKPHVETKLTGAIGDTWGEADALLGATKEAARSTDASLLRDVRPAIDKKLTKEINAALDRAYAPGGAMKLYSNPIGPALAELRKYPSAVAVGLVGYAMTDSDNPNIQRAGVPTMALAALSAIGSARIMEGADKLGSKLVETLRKSDEGTQAVRFFNPDALLTPEVRQAIIKFERERAKGQARSAEFAGKAKALGPEGDRKVSDVLDNEDWENDAHFTAQQTTDVLSVAGELAQEYDRLTQAQLAAGTITPEQAIPNYGGPRRYAFYEAQDALADTPRSPGGGGSPRIGATKSRTLDIPIREAEAALKEAKAGGDATAIAEAQSALGQAQAVQMSQRLERGEIREASYRAASKIEKVHNNVASAKLFETIRNAPGAAHPDWASAVDEMRAAKDMAAKATTPADRDAAKVLQNEAAVKLDAVTRRYARKGGEYVSLPDTPAMGMLRGAVVKRDIAHSLEGFGKLGTPGKMLRGWKEIKTVFNVGTSIGNILSNVTALHMGDVPVWLQPYYYVAAAKDMRNYGEATRALAEDGQLNVNAVSALGEGNLGRNQASEEGLHDLLKTTRPETADVLRAGGITEEAASRRAQKTRLKGLAAGAVIGAAKGYDDENPAGVGEGAVIGAGIGALFHGKGADWVRKLYANEDNIARLAVFMRRRNLGDTIEQATERARSSLGDFRTRSPALKVLASSVSPFILYQAKAVPAFARNVIDHPWKYLTLMAAWGAVNEMGKQDMGEIPETDIPVADRRTYGYFFPGITQLSFGDEQGNKAAVDMARWTPMSGLTTGAPPGSAPEAFSDNASQLVTPGGPVIDAGLKMSNFDPYTRGPLLPRDRPVAENVKTALNATADFVLPSALGFHATRLKADLDNADWTKFKNDLLGPTGAKPKYIRPGAVIQDASYTLSRDLRDMKAALKRDLRANKDEDRRGLLVDRYKRRVGQALINFKTRIGVPPDQAIVEDALADPTPEP